MPAVKDSHFVDYCLPKVARQDLFGDLLLMSSYHCYVRNYSFRELGLLLERATKM